MNNKVHVRDGDKVMVISGAGKGRVGKIIGVSPAEGKVIVEKVHMATKHLKARKAGDPSGLVKAERAIYACKVMPICSRCNKPTRVGHKITADGEKLRICRHCGESF